MYMSKARTGYRKMKSWWKGKTKGNFRRITVIIYRDDVKTED